jgi:hypothetical protein
MASRCRRKRDECLRRERVALGSCRSPSTCPPAHRLVDQTANRLAPHIGVFAFHDGDEIGPKMLARIAKHTGLNPDDL